MPLIRDDRPDPETVSSLPREALFDQLAGADIGKRRLAALALSGDRNAAPALAASLETELEPGVRDALFRSLVMIGGTPAAKLFQRLLRSADAGLRGGAVEALKRLGVEAVPVLDILLDDPDSDVRLLAIEVTRAWPSALAMPRLLHIIEQDPHANVCGAAVDVATEVGTGDLLPALAGLRVRFVNDPFLVFAIGVASSRIDGDSGRRGA